MCNLDNSTLEDNLRNLEPTKMFWLNILPFQNWPEAEFHIVPDAGHSACEPGIQTLLLNATDKYKLL